MRTRMVLGGLMAAALLCGCAARLPVGDDAIARPVAGSASDADRGPLTSPFLRTEASPGQTTRYQRVAEELRSGPGLCCPPYEEEAFERNHLNVFLGYTWERGEGGPTIGIDYVWRLNEQIGVGPFVDYVAGDVEAFAFGALLYLEPWKGLVVCAGPGIDLDREEDEHGRKETEASFLFRIGVAYEFELGKGWTLGPGVFWDLIAPKRQAWAAGLNLSKNW